MFRGVQLNAPKHDRPYIFLFLPPRAAAVRAIGLSRRHGLAAVAAVGCQALAAMRAKSKAGIGHLAAVRAWNIARRRRHVRHRRWGLARRPPGRPVDRMLRPRVWTRVSLR